MGDTLPAPISNNREGSLPIFIGTQSSVQQRVSTPGLGYRQPLLNGEQGTEQTVKLMRQLIDAALSDAGFVRQAIDIVRSVPAFNDLGEVQALYNWVRRNIRYTKDPVTKEKLYPPQELLKIKAGDCDDIAMLLGAFLIALGYPARLVTISANAQHPEEFSHVYVEGEVPAGSGQWIPMDAARLDAEFGLEPPMYFRKRAWSLTDSSYQDLNGSTRLHGLAGYASVGLGQDDGIDWGSILQQSIQEVPAIISTARGGSSAVRNPYGTVQTGPYGSFATPYTPGWGVPAAGYSSPGLSSGFSSWIPWLLGGLILFAVVNRGKSA